MKKINNLMGAMGNIPSDKDILQKYGEEINSFKELYEKEIIDYIQGLIKLSMTELHYQDKDIEKICLKVSDNYYDKTIKDIFEWNWTHIFEK